MNGVIAASLAAPLEVFNLGNTHPEKVSALIGYLEQGLGRKANITRAPITAGDVPVTYADVSHARERPVLAQVCSPRASRASSSGTAATTASSCLRGSRGAAPPARAA